MIGERSSKVIRVIGADTYKEVLSVNNGAVKKDRHTCASAVAYVRLLFTSYIMFLSKLWNSFYSVISCLRSANSASECDFGMLC